MAERRKVILDTDPGIDDAMALLFLAASPALELRAMTTVFGNADVATTTRNALYLRRRFGLDVPVHAGAAAPLARARNDSPLHIHGRNGLGDVAIDDLDVGDADPLPAAAALVDMIRASPGELTLLAIAPLTNLAQALALDPGIAQLVPEVIVMGGAFGFHGRGGNVSRFAEANIYNDPEAANVVFEASWKVTMVGLDVTSDCVLTPSSSARLARHAGEPGRFIEAIATPYTAAYRDFDGVDGCVAHDVAAVAMAIDPTLFRTRHGAIAARTDGIMTGQTIQTPKADSLQRVCTDVDAGRLMSLFESTLVSASAAA